MILWSYWDGGLFWFGHGVVLNFPTRNIIPQKNQEKSFFSGKLFYSWGIMNITQHHLSLIAGRFRDVSKPKITQTMLAEHMGLGKPWASKLLGGTMKTLSDDQVRKLEAFLDVRLRDVVTHIGDVSPLALEATRLMDGNEPLTKAIQAVLSLASVPVPIGPVSPSWIPTPEMSRVGQEIIRIAYANEDKPGKVARMVIELLSREAQKQTAKK